MTIADSVSELTPLLVKRLGLTTAEAEAVASAFLEAVLEQAVVNVRSQNIGPTALSSSRVQLVEALAARLGRLPTARELTALLRVPEATSRSILRNVLSISDRVNDVALKSVFNRASRGGSVGRQGNPKNGEKWQLSSSSDLEFARELLEARGIRYSTQKADDGDYVLVVDPAFDPQQL